MSDLFAGDVAIKTIGGRPLFTAADMLERLRRHYLKPVPMPGGIFVPEWCLNDGSNSRRCDAIFAGFTSASGRRLVGHEIKISRADWMHELDQPGKADRFHDSCHQWWVVAPSTDIVPVETLPAGWGLLVIDPRTKTRMKAVVKAEDRDVTPSWLVTRSIMARNDTLARGELAQAKHDYRQELQREFDGRLAEIRATGIMPDERDSRKLAIQAVIIELEKRRAGDMWATRAKPEDVAEVLTDLVGARIAARDLRAHLSGLMRDVVRITSPFGGTFGELAKIAEQLGKED